jgi:hypothetical protein
MPEPKHRAPTIRDLYPELSEEDLKEAEENLARYIAATLRLYEAIVADPDRYARFQALTKGWEGLTINGNVEPPSETQPS